MIKRLVFLSFTFYTFFDSIELFLPFICSEILTEIVLKKCIGISFYFLSHPGESFRMNKWCAIWLFFQIKIGVLILFYYEMFCRKIKTTSLWFTILPHDSRKLMESMSLSIAQKFIISLSSIRKFFLITKVDSGAKGNLSWNFSPKIKKICMIERMDNQYLVLNI